MSGVALILLQPSGIVFRNQSGGYACVQSHAEGILVPFNNGFDSRDPRSAEAQLSTLTVNSRMTPEVADRIDAVLAASPFTSSVKVDRARLEECYEAWIHVIYEPERAGWSLLMGFEKGSGVLTWPNSD